MASLTVENYVKAIALIGGRDPAGDRVGTGQLAAALSVSPGTVTGMLVGWRKFTQSSSNVVPCFMMDIHDPARCERPTSAAAW